MIQPIIQKIDFSIMHTNIQSIKCNGEKLECLLNSMNGKFDIIALSETWHCEKNKHLFNPIKLDGYWVWRQNGVLFKGRVWSICQRRNYLHSKTGLATVKVKWNGLKLLRKINATKL